MTWYRRAAAGQLVMAVGVKGVRISDSGGVSFGPGSPIEYSDTVELPSTWLFVSGRHEIEVVRGGER